MTSRILAIAAIAALTLACGTDPHAAAPTPATTVLTAALVAPTPLQLWAHDRALEAPARAAAARILAATGLVVEVNAAGTSATAVPMFLSEQHGKWIGLCGTDQAWIAIDAGLVRRPADLPAVVLHEIMHALGAQHTTEGVVAVMAADLQCRGTGALTADDLVDVCAQQACTTFVPE